MNKLIIILFLSICGILFAGYLSYKKIFLGICPLNEGCPFLFGYPTCMYGFFIFSIIFLLSIIVYFMKNKKLISYICIMSFVGILFSGYYSIYELFFLTCGTEPCVFSMILPSCVYGGIMYIIIFMLSIQLHNENRFK